MAEQKQLTFATLGGDIVTVQMRGKHYVQPKGYAAFPGTGPQGETCGSCKHICRQRRWAKCELVRGRWTGGRGSDVLVRAPACRRWERPDGEREASV